MGFDLVILVATCTALLRNSTRSGLWQLLFRDGLVYWGLAFSANAVPAVSTISIKLCEENFCSDPVVFINAQILNSLDLNGMLRRISTLVITKLNLF